MDAPKLDLYNIFKHGKALTSTIKRKRRKFKLPPNSEKKSRASLVSVNSPWMTFFLKLLANAVNSGHDQGERCLSALFFALLTFWHVQFSKIFAFLFPPKLTSIHRQNWSREIIPKSQNSDKAASFSSVSTGIKT